MSEFKLPCNCTWSLGIGPNLLCPVHGSSHHISATLTEARGKIRKLRERIALLEAHILNAAEQHVEILREQEDKPQ
jgi:hypothetical protein